MSEDQRLDTEFAYTGWGESCKAPHPERAGVVCRRPWSHVTDSDETHAVGWGNARATWDLPLDNWKP